MYKVPLSACVNGLSTLNWDKHLQEILFTLRIQDNFPLFTLVVPMWSLANAAGCPNSIEGGKGYFRDSWSALFFPVKCEMANFFLVNRDFHSSREAWFCKIIFRETRNKCLIRREPWFSLCRCYFQQPLLRNKWYFVTVTGRLIPVATTWLVWFSVTFNQPSFSSSVSSISTIMAKAHQRDVQDDQDRQQGQQACMVLPNATVLIIFFFNRR